MVAERKHLLCIGASLYKFKGPRDDKSRPGIEPGLPAWEASTLEKSHLDNLFANHSELLLGLRLAL